jgi:hypothetical protein
MLMNVLEKIRDKFNHGLVLFSMSNRLSRIGFKIIPYCLVREYICDELDLKPKLKMSSVVVGFLEPTDITTLLTHPEISHVDRSEMKKCLTDDCLCFGIKHKGNIAAYMWCNLQKCHEMVPPLKLKDDEAYLFGAYTFRAYRGRNLAPYLRYQMYRNLTRMGRNKFYSITEFFNTPAMNFKKKLKARPLELYLSIAFFGKYHFNVRLKEYEGKNHLNSYGRPKTKKTNRGG